ncbi:type II secretion system F family protein [Thalassobius vesicularis]|uniref:Type II secretion system F family protein n=1 Tax=Thalassobius vesicularis TaxID=1294297 RepID=A0A4S3M6Z5_9RHOB|nr:type II secretion system F family protein [Thalassobius vesicularis]THD72939.1 type II secretion system F family protein [Thalassobius vesicularis]
MDIFTSILGPELGAIAPLLLVGFLALALIVVAAFIFLNQKADPLEKLNKEASPEKLTKKVAKGGGLRTAKSNDKLEKYSTFLEPQNEKEYSAVRQKLLQAGYRSKDSVRFYHFAQFALGLIGLIIGVAYFMLVLSGKEPTTQQTMMWILGPGCGGYMLPKYWVTKRQQKRQEEITQGFPDALDMMLVCVEAGQSLDQSIIRVSKEIRSSFPALADEFEIVSHQIKAGKDKPTVLADMGERCGVADVSSFVTVLVQSATFGTSIAEALRVYAGEMRDKRVMRAEEAANKLPTKMTLATMALTVPPLLIILVAPSAIGILELGK